MDVIYVLFINPDFIEQYYTSTLAHLEATLPPAEFELKKASMEAEKELFSSPLVQFIVMSLTVFVIAFIVTLISSYFLQTKPVSKTSA